MKEEEGVITEFKKLPLRILGERFPQSLLKFCSLVPSKVGPEPGLHILAEAVLESNLSGEEKKAGLRGMWERMGSPLRGRIILQYLAQIDEKGAIALLQPVLPKLPRDVDEPYWNSEVPTYTHVVMELQDDVIWRQYLKVAKRSSVGLRMEMMNPMNYFYIGEKNRGRRLSFLAAFLDDTTVRDPSAHPEKYTGPYAGFTLGKINVQDFAAAQIASILKMGKDPTEFWTVKDWKDLRKEVENALSKEKLPVLQSRLPSHSP